MLDPLPGELLCYGLLVILCGRIFFIKGEKIVSITVLAPLVLLLSVLQIVAWGAGLPELIILLLSILTFTANIHALVRFFQHLYVDRYSPLFYIASVILLLCTLAAAAGTVCFRPVPSRPADFGVTVQKKLLTGSVGSGFTVRSHFREKNTGVLWTFTPSDSTTMKKTIIIFSPDKRADTARYMPYLLLLAQAGYPVITADLYSPGVRWISPFFDTSPLRRSAMIYLSLQKPDVFEALGRNFTGNMINEYSALIDIGTHLFGSATRFFLVGDGMGNGALKAVFEKYPYQAAGVWSLDAVGEYKTAGYGCIEQTAPVLAAIFGMKRDSSLFIPRYMALKTRQAVTGKGGVK